MSIITTQKNITYFYNGISPKFQHTSRDFRRVNSDEIVDDDLEHHKWIDIGIS